MAPTERPWLRLYSEITRDRKLRRETPAVRWLWITLMAMAGASPKRGSLLVGNSPATLEDIADEAALPIKQVRVGMTYFESAGMIEKNGDGAWHLRNWAERQYESDVSTDRVRAFRERRRNVSGNGSVTPPESESDTEDHQQPLVGTPDRIEVTVRAVLERYADARMEGISAGTPGPYRARVIANGEADWGDKLRKIIPTHPDAPVETLADWVLGNPTSLERYRIEATS